VGEEWLYQARGQVGAGAVAMAQRSGMLRDADSFYVEDCRTVQTNTHAIQTLTGQISRLVGTLETDKDFRHCHKMVDDAVRQASETRQILARIQEHQRQAQNTAEKNNRRMMYQKLSDNLSITARVLEDVIRRFTAEERVRLAQGDHDAGACTTAALNTSVSVAGSSSRSSAPPGASGSGGSSFFSPADSAAGRGGEPEALDGNSGERVALVPMEGSAVSGDSLQEELKRDRCQALHKVSEDMQSLQRIYTDLAQVNEAQQTSFDTLESHMANAAADIERGRDELMITKYSWDRRAKRKLWHIAGGILAFTTLAFFMIPS